MPKVKKNKGGRKSKYTTHVLPNLERIPSWRKQGLTEEQIARKLGVAMSTFSDYKLKYSELMEVLKKGKEHLVEELETSLFKRAMGYDTEEVKIEKNENGVVIRTTTTTKHIVPDVGAIAFALKNLTTTWRDRQDITLDGKLENKTSIDMSKFSKEELMQLAKDD